MTGDETQDYFSDGLTEDTIAQLGRLDAKEFGVIARTSVMHYKHTSEKMDQIGGELGAQHSNGLTSLKVEPAYDPLCSDPRFQQLLQRVGLAP